MLRKIMIANALSCLAFGALFAAGAGRVASFLGSPPEWLIFVLGIGLLINGVHLIIAGRKPSLGQAEVIYFALGDFAWVGLTAVLLVLGIWITAPWAVAVASLVALWVGFCGVMQWRLAATG